MATRLGRLEAGLATTTARAAEVEAARTTSISRAASLAPVAERLAADVREAEQAAEGTSAAEEADRVAERLRDARTSLEEATTHAQDLRGAYLDLREARISGMAAELAGSLAVGCSCPVCGSAEHPAPAVSATGVTRADEDAARARYETADFERLNVRELVTTLAGRAGPRRRRSDARSAEDWRGVRRTSVAALAESTAATEARVTVREELAAQEAEAAELGAQRAALEATLAEHRRTHEQSGLRRGTTRRRAARRCWGTRRAPRSRGWSTTTRRRSAPSRPPDAAITARRAGGA